MADLYGRLKAIGFDRTFVRAAVLPDWWSDDLASVPANRAVAEIAIARHFGFSAAALRDRTRPLSLPAKGGVRLKRSVRTTEAEVSGAVAVARRAAELVAESLIDFPAFNGPFLASAVRTGILRNSAFVELASLLAFCWSHGIPVVHLSRTSKKSKKIDGLATFCGDRPVVVLCSGRDSPPWLAFHLTHELGHIMRAHIRPGGAMLADADLDKRDDDAQEQEADQFALEALTGQTALGFTPEPGLTAPKLALAASNYGEQHRIAPGTVALIYGRSANRWGPAQKALTYLGQDTGEHERITNTLRANLPLADLPETTARFLGACVGFVE
jgi:hypothetical protein